MSKKERDRKGSMGNGSNSHKNRFSYLAWNNPKAEFTPLEEQSINERLQKQFEASSKSQEPADSTMQDLRKIIQNRQAHNYYSED